MTVLIKNPNFLILDEPTNDLDLLTLNKLEEFLMGFNGCLILVSHDRYFMDKLVDHLFIFEGDGQIKDFNGTYTEYRLQKVLENREVSKKDSQIKVGKPDNRESAKFKTWKPKNPNWKSRFRKTVLACNSSPNIQKKLEILSNPSTSKLNDGWSWQINSKNPHHIFVVHELHF